MSSFRPIKIIRDVTKTQGFARVNSRNYCKGRGVGAEEKLSNRPIAKCDEYVNEPSANLQHVSPPEPETGGWRSFWGGGTRPPLLPPPQLETVETSINNDVPSTQDSARSPSLLNLLTSWIPFLNTRSSSRIVEQVEGAKRNELDASTLEYVGDSRDGIHSFTPTLEEETLTILEQAQCFSGEFGLSQLGGNSVSMPNNKVHVQPTTLTRRKSQDSFAVREANTPQGNNYQGRTETRFYSTAPSCAGDLESNESETSTSTTDLTPNIPLLELARKPDVVDASFSYTKPPLYNMEDDDISCNMPSSVNTMESSPVDTCGSATEKATMSTDLITIKTPLTSRPTKITPVIILPAPNPPPSRDPMPSSSDLAIESLSTMVSPATKTNWSKPLSNSPMKTSSFPSTINVASQNGRRLKSLPVREKTPFEKYLNAFKHTKHITKLTPTQPQTQKAANTVAPLPESPPRPRSNHKLEPKPPPAHIRTSPFDKYLNTLKHTKKNKKITPTQPQSQNAANTKAPLPELPLTPQSTHELESKSSLISTAIQLEKQMSTKILAPGDKFPFNREKLPQSNPNSTSISSPQTTTVDDAFTGQINTPLPELENEIASTPETSGPQSKLGSLASSSNQNKHTSEIHPKVSKMNEAFPAQIETPLPELEKEITTTPETSPPSESDSLATSSNENKHTTHIHSKTSKLYEAFPAEIKSPLPELENEITTTPETSPPSKSDSLSTSYNKNKHTTQVHSKASKLYEAFPAKIKTPSPELEKEIPSSPETPPSYNPDSLATSSNKNKHTTHIVAKTSRIYEAFPAKIKTPLQELENEISTIPETPQTSYSDSLATSSNKNKHKTHIKSKTKDTHPAPIRTLLTELRNKTFITRKTLPPSKRDSSARLFNKVKPKALTLPQTKVASIAFSSPTKTCLNKLQSNNDATTETLQPPTPQSSAKLLDNIDSKSATRSQTSNLSQNISSTTKNLEHELRNEPPDTLQQCEESSSSTPLNELQNDFSSTTKFPLPEITTTPAITPNTMQQSKPISSDPPSKQSQNKLATHPQTTITHDITSTSNTTEPEVIKNLPSTLDPIQPSTSCSSEEPLNKLNTETNNDSQTAKPSKHLVSTDKDPLPETSIEPPESTQTPKPSHSAKHFNKINLESFNDEQTSNTSNDVSSTTETPLSEIESKPATTPVMKRLSKPYHSGKQFNKINFKIDNDLHTSKPSKDWSSTTNTPLPEDKSKAATSRHAIQTLKTSHLVKQFNKMKFKPDNELEKSKPLNNFSSPTKTPLNEIHSKAATKPDMTQTPKPSHSVKQLNKITFKPYNDLQSSKPTDNLSSTAKIPLPEVQNKASTTHSLIQQSKTYHLVEQFNKIHFKNGNESKTSKLSKNLSSMAKIPLPEVKSKEASTPDKIKTPKPSHSTKQFNKINFKPYNDLQTSKPSDNLSSTAKIPLPEVKRKAATPPDKIETPKPRHLAKQFNKITINLDNSPQTSKPTNNLSFTATIPLPEVHSKAATTPSLIQQSKTYHLVKKFNKIHFKTGDESETSDPSHNVSSTAETLLPEIKIKPASTPDTTHTPKPSHSAKQFNEMNFKSFNDAQTSGPSNNMSSTGKTPLPEITSKEATTSNTTHTPKPSHSAKQFNKINFKPCNDLQTSKPSNNLPFTAKIPLSEVKRKAATSRDKIETPKHLAKQFNKITFNLDNSPQTSKPTNNLSSTAKIPLHIAHCPLQVNSKAATTPSLIQQSKTYHLVKKFNKIHFKTGNESETSDPSHNVSTKAKTPLPEIKLKPASTPDATQTSKPSHLAKQFNKMNFKSFNDAQTSNPSSNVSSTCKTPLPEITSKEDTTPDTTQSPKPSHSAKQFNKIKFKTFNDAQTSNPSSNVSSTSKTTLPEITSKEDTTPDTTQSPKSSHSAKQFKKINFKFFNDAQTSNTSNNVSSMAKTPLPENKCKAATTADTMQPSKPNLSSKQINKINFKPYNEPQTSNPSNNVTSVAKTPLPENKSKAATTADTMQPSKPSHLAKQFNKNNFKEDNKPETSKPTSNLSSTTMTPWSEIKIKPGRTQGTIQPSKPCSPAKPFTETNFKPDNDLQIPKPSKKLSSTPESSLSVFGNTTATTPDTFQASKLCSSVKSLNKVENIIPTRPHTSTATRASLEKTSSPQWLLNIVNRTEQTPPSKPCASAISFNVVQKVIPALPLTQGASDSTLITDSLSPETSLLLSQNIATTHPQTNPTSWAFNEGPLRRLKSTKNVVHGTLPAHNSYSSATSSFNKGKIITAIPPQIPTVSRGFCSIAKASLPKVENKLGLTPKILTKTFSSATILDVKNSTTCQSPNPSSTKSFISISTVKTKPKFNPPLSAHKTQLSKTGPSGNDQIPSSVAQTASTSKALSSGAKAPLLRSTTFTKTCAQAETQSKVFLSTEDHLRQVSRTEKVTSKDSSSTNKTLFFCNLKTQPTLMNKSIARPSTTLPQTFPLQNVKRVPGYQSSPSKYGLSGKNKGRGLLITGTGSYSSRAYSSCATDEHVCENDTREALSNMTFETARVVGKVTDLVKDQIHCRRRKEVCDPTTFKWQGSYPCPKKEHIKRSWKCRAPRMLNCAKPASSICSRSYVKRKPCQKIEPPVPSFSECVRDIPKSMISGECLSTSHLRYLQPCEPIFGTKNTIDKPSTMGRFIDPCLDEYCLSRSLDLGPTPSSSSLPSTKIPKCVVYQCLFQGKKLPTLTGCRQPESTSCDRHQVPKPCGPRRLAPRPSFSECYKLPFPKRKNRECEVAQQRAKIMADVLSRGIRLSLDSIFEARCKKPGVTKTCFDYNDEESFCKQASKPLECYEYPFVSQNPNCEDPYDECA